MVCLQVLLAINLTALLEYCVSMMPLMLRAKWQERGIDLNFASIWPLKVELSYIESDDAKKGGESGSSNVGLGGGSTTMQNGNNLKGGNGKTSSGKDGLMMSAAQVSKIKAEEKREAQRRLRWHVALRTPMIAVTEDIWLQYYIM